VRRGGFQWGERVPDFRLFNTEGRLARLYSRFRGNALLLLFCPDLSRERGRQLVLDVFGRQAVFRSLETGIAAVTLQGHEANAAFCAELGLEADILSDPAGAISKAFGGLETPVLYVLDANQRVFDVLRPAEDRPLEVQAEAALEVLHGRPAEAPRSPAQAPVLVLPRVFEPALCRRLIDDWGRDHHEGEVRLRRAKVQSAATKVVDHAMKKRRDHTPDAAMNERLRALVQRRLVPEMLKVFQFETVAVEDFCIGAYAADRGDYFRPHRDNTTAHTMHRRFAVTINLNDDFEGGGLRFPEYASAVYNPPTGGAVVFSCSLLHEAVPVTAGCRFVALSFLYDREAVPRR
jgi:peroxiredoxin/predicted 2-oxoglutarate/Fe(II)-dependent dioxygenase YbiX